MSEVGRPGRRPAPVPDPDSVLGCFARALRELRNQAGGPSYATLAREAARLGSPYSETSLRNAASGRVRPSWDAVAAFVQACAAFARTHPQRAEEIARDWSLPVLLDLWAVRWREASASAGPEMPDEAPGPAAPRRDLPGNLPSALTGLVGRGQELAQGTGLLRTARLVTLTGVGGVGKTSLALRVAEEAAPWFPDGLWLVELAELTEQAMVGRAVAAVLGVQSNAGQEPLEAMAEALGGRRVLLVLDNCEHLLDATAAVTRSLLRAVPGLRVLATSRQPLDVTGERVLAIGPLQLPEETGADSAAVDLFVGRAQAVLPGFRLTAENRAAVVSVCRLLDGLPLALELAARRLRTLSVNDLLDRLDRRFLLLGSAGAERTAHPRHRTLSAVFDWSYELCSPAERAAWEQLSAAAGGVSLADAEALCAGGSTGQDSAFEAIAGLVDKSLLRRVETQGRTRLHLLETVRLYGRERLASSGREHEARRRHQDRYLGLARRAEEEYATPRQAEWLVRLAEEHANLRLALTHVPAEDGTLFEGAYALWLYWVASGKVGEGVHWMRPLAERHPRPPRAEPAPSWCRAQWSIAFVLLLHGDRAAAERVLDRLEPVIGREGDEWAGIRAALHQLRGLSAMVRGDVEQIEKHSSTALRLDGHRPGMLTAQQALAQLGVAASIRGAREEARDFFRRALELSEACGEIWHRSYLRWTLAIECAETGRVEEATTLLWRSLDLKRRLGDRLGAATVSETLAGVLAQRGEPRVAALLLGAAHATWQVAGAPQLWGISHLVHSRARNIGRIQRMLGDGSYQKEYRQGERLGLVRVLTALADERS
ncbi:LuxR family transcriptional regulator [Nonomuraea spiralis]|nr:LuxR family transcriptional regulator [Nonomuraea spiralis]